LGIPLELVPRGFTSQLLSVFVPRPTAPAQEVLDLVAFILSRGDPKGKMFK
jgi:hypothetical protein